MVRLGELRRSPLMISAAVGIVLSGCLTLPLAPTTTESRHLLLGNPSGATTNLLTPNNYLITRPQYALSYNRDKGIPNWVSWQLNASWLGTLPRPDQFEPDPDLPDGWYRVTSNDYTRSGFDRGHMVPAADRNRTPDDSRSVFLMTNIVPQAPDNNQGPWNDLEIYCRQLVEQGYELYIVAGPVGAGGVGREGGRRAIANERVVVPEFVWKVIVVLNRPGAGIESINESTRVIAVLMPNRQGIKTTSWKRYRQSVDTIEGFIGYDLLSNIPQPLQETLEARVDRQ